MVSQKKWAALSRDEKIETLHEEIETTKSNTRSLKKVLTDVVAKVNDLRRYLGMKQAI